MRGLTSSNLLILFNSRSLGGKFELKKTFDSKLDKANPDRNAPGSIFVVHGRKIPGKIYMYQETTNLLLQKMSKGEQSLEELDLEHVLKYGAAADIVAERAAANAFAEHEKRKGGWEKRLLRSWLIAVRHNPRFLLNRGMLAIGLRTVRATLQ